MSLNGFSFFNFYNAVVFLIGVQTVQFAEK